MPQKSKKIIESAAYYHGCDRCRSVGWITTSDGEKLIPTRSKRAARLLLEKALEFRLIGSFEKKHVLWSINTSFQPEEVILDAGFEELLEQVTKSAQLLLGDRDDHNHHPQIYIH